MPLVAEAPTPPTLGDMPPDAPELLAVRHPAASATFSPLVAKIGLRRPATAALAGWAVSFALLAALGWGGVRWRSDVMRAWPPSERLYAALGLTPSPPAQ